MNATRQRSARLLLTLAAGSLGWVFLMSLLPSRRGIAANEIPSDDPSMTAAIAAIDRQKFPKISLSLRIADANGETLRSLNSSQFRVYEEGRLVSVSEFASAGDQAISVYLVIDQSGSMAGPKLPGAKQAALAMMGLMRDGTDRLGVVAFDNTINEVVPMGLVDQAHRSRAQTAIQAINIGGGTHFYQSLEQTLTRMEGVPGRRILLALTDGEDSEGGFGGFLQNSDARIDRIAARARELDVPIYTVGLGGRGAFDENVLRTIAEKSGGQFLQTADPAELANIYQRIGTALQNEYGLSYQSPYPADGLTRKVQVVINRNGSGKVAEGSYPTIGVGPQRLAAGADNNANANATATAAGSNSSTTAPSAPASPEGGPVFSVFIPVFVPLLLMMLVPYGRRYLGWKTPSGLNWPTSKTPPSPPPLAPSNSGASSSSSASWSASPSSSSSPTLTKPPSVPFNPVPAPKPPPRPQAQAQTQPQSSPSASANSNSRPVSKPPAAPTPAPPPAPPTTNATNATNANACPSCGKLYPGARGQRYCLVCEIHF